MNVFSYEDVAEIQMEKPSPTYKADRGGRETRIDPFLISKNLISKTYHQVVVPFSDHVCERYD